MAKIPACVASSVDKEYSNIGAKLFSRGKVRDTYTVLERPDWLLMVATDRLSIFDFVLPVLIPRKGEILTALTHFWLTNILNDFPHHLEFVLDKNALVVKKTKIPPFEMIFRHHLGGSVYQKYLKTGMAGGHVLRPNLSKWSFLEEPLFTPSTKEETGHDLNVDESDYLMGVGEEHGKRAIEMFREAYKCAYAFAKDRGILILDTKFEGIDMIADEVLTPDSSRFTTVEDFDAAIAEGRDPIFFDKQFVRDYALTLKTPFGKKLNKLDPENVEHLAWVHNSVVIPPEIVEDTTARYLQIFERITGSALEEYQFTTMELPTM